MLKNSDFKSICVIERDVDAMWFRLIQELFDNGTVIPINKGSRAGEYRLEFDSINGTILSPIQYSDTGIRLPLAPTVPAGCPQPTSDDQINKYFLEYIMKGEVAPNEHYTYGHFLVGLKHEGFNLQTIHVNKLYPRDSFGKVDIHKYKKISDQPYNQVEWVLDHLRQGLFQNHGCMQVGYPQSNLAYDWPYIDEMSRGTSPCLRIVDVKCIPKNDKIYLCMYVYFRSWDLFGWPENIGGLSLLLEYMATMLSSEEQEILPGALIFNSKGLHMYSGDFQAFEMRAGRKLDEIARKKLMGE